MVAGIAALRGADSRQARPRVQFRYGQRWPGAQPGQLDSGGDGASPPGVDAVVLFVRFVTGPPAR